MKKRIAFLLIYFSFILPGESFLVKAELINNKEYAWLFNKEYTCEGEVKTMFNSFPITVTLRDRKLSWKIHRNYDNFFDANNDGIGSDLLTFYTERQNIEFDVKYSDGVLVKRIDDNKLSVKMSYVTGTFLEDSCQLEMPVEQQTIGPILNFFGF
tara:strand:- start:550 stop:1014 length:465 start_codon:yes stop_codon:yes gene_type:complete